MVQGIMGDACYCKCHKVGKERCGKCRVFHLSSEKPQTDRHDKYNPDFKKVDISAPSAE